MRAALRHLKTKNWQITEHQQDWRPLSKESRRCTDNASVRTFEPPVPEATSWENTTSLDHHWRNAEKVNPLLPVLQITLTNTSAHHGLLACTSILWNRFRECSRRGVLVQHLPSHRKSTSRSPGPKRTLEHQIRTPADGPKKDHDDALKADVHITHSHEQRTQTYDLFHMQNQERDNPDEFDLHFQQYMKTSGLRLLNWDERIGNFTSSTWCVTLACPSRKTRARHRHAAHASHLQRPDPSWIVCSKPSQRRGGVDMCKRMQTSQP